MSEEDQDRESRERMTAICRDPDGAVVYDALDRDFSTLDEQEQAEQALLRLVVRAKE